LSSAAFGSILASDHGILKNTLEFKSTLEFKNTLENTTSVDHAI